MDEQKFIQPEIRRSRSRKQDRKKKEAVETLLLILLSLILWAAFFICVGAIWLTDPAYGADKTYMEVLTVSEEDYTDLCEVLASEAGDDSLEGQKAVVEVIGNRVLSEHYPNTVIEVLSQRGQFCAWKKRHRNMVMQEQIFAVEAVRLGTESVMTEYIAAAGLNTDPREYVFFCTPEVYLRLGHRYMRNIIRIGKHVFGTR